MWRSNTGGRRATSSECQSWREYLVRRHAAVIVAAGSIGTALAAKAATSVIPIVFMNGGDPVKYGLVASFNRPGGNLTGFSFRANEIAGKRLEFLSELVPQATTIAFLSAPPSALAYEEQKTNMLEAGRSLGRTVMVLECRNESDFEIVFATLVDRGAGALIVGTFPPFYELRNRDRILKLASHHQIPGMYPHRMYVTAGGLMSYGTGAGAYRQVGLDYVGRILKARAQPICLSSNRQISNLAINLKTAKRSASTVPSTLLVAASEVIE